MRNWGKNLVITMEKINKEKNTERQVAHIHYLAALIGGYLGLFPIVNVANVLGSAQTTNLIEIVLAILVGDGSMAFFHGIGALIFCLSIVLATVIPKHSRLDIQLLAMIFDTLCGLLMFLFPKNAPVVCYLYPTFFALTFHWCAFKGAYGYTCSSIFSTNNLRMCISALVEVLINKDKSFKIKACFFGMTLIFFHLGIIISWIGWHFMGNISFLGVITPTLFCTLRILAVKK